MFFKVGVKGLQHYVACNSNTDVFPWILRDLNCLMFALHWKIIFSSVKIHINGDQLFLSLSKVIPYFFISRQEAAKYENEEE